MEALLNWRNYASIFIAPTEATVCTLQNAVLMYHFQTCLGTNLLPGLVSFPVGGRDRLGTRMPSMTVLYKYKKDKNNNDQVS